VKYDNSETNAKQFCLLKIRHQGYVWFGLALRAKNANVVKWSDYHHDRHCIRHSRHVITRAIWSQTNKSRETRHSPVTLLDTPVISENFRDTFQKIRKHRQFYAALLEDSAIDATWRAWRVRLVLRLLTFVIATVLVNWHSTTIARISISRIRHFFAYSKRSWNGEIRAKYRTTLACVRHCHLCPAQWWKRFARHMTRFSIGMRASRVLLLASLVRALSATRLISPDVTWCHAFNDDHVTVREFPTNTTAKIYPYFATYLSLTVILYFYFWLLLQPTSYYFVGK